MNTDEIKKLKSGTDVRGVAVIQNKARDGVRLTDTAVYDIAAAFAFFLKARLKKDRLSLAVGHDSRITSQSLSEAAACAFMDSGSDVHVCGLITTPAMFMMTKFEQTKADGVIMITASHHPYYMNGMKFFTRDGGISSKDLEQILELAGQSKRLISEGFTLKKSDYRSLYSELLRNQIIEFSGLGNKPLSGMKIVVDAGNGAAGFFASEVLEPLGADTSHSQFLDADGYFPNHAPNPEDKVAMQSVKDRVLACGADLGIIFDTDGDRVGIVTSDGEEINRNRLIAAAAALILEDKKNAGAYIVTDSVTSDGLSQFIAARGGVHFRYKRGYKNVIDKAVELCGSGKNAELAIETSGHAAFRDNYFLDDGAYLAVRLIAKAVQFKASGRSLRELIDGLSEPAESIEARLTLTSSDWKSHAGHIINELTEFAKASFELAKDNHEGIRARINEADGWFLLRLSVHDPVMPLNIESDKTGGAKMIAAKLIEFLTKFEMLDISALKKHL